ncbi:MAG: alpha/beta fold hydrolase [Gammaproteobacteria bacterium]|nr:alpha/beta fold hydrolase [Gammaproteobacteria bacterium]
MSSVLRLVVFCCCVLPLSFCFAEDALNLPETEIDITARDGADLNLHQYAAQGEYLAIWIASGYGLSPRDVQMAKGLARRGVEVWQIDFAQTLFQVGGSNFMRSLNPDYVVDLINAAQQRTHKKVILISHSYGAIPALRGATLWQQSPRHAGRLAGVVLISPDLYAAIPELGFKPEYLSITRATNIPLMIYQAGKRGNAGQFPLLLQELRTSNPTVFFKWIPDVTSPMYAGDTGKETQRVLRTLPGELVGVFHLLDSIPMPATAPAYTFRHEGEARLDSRLKPYTAHPQPDAISLYNADDKHFDIRDYKGKVSVINFWATWCHPCREEIPSLNNLRKAMHGKAFQLISINYAESAATIKAFLKEVNVEYPVLLDKNGDVSAKWNVIAYPSTFVIGSDGKIHYGVNAAIDWDAPEVIRLLEGLLPK